MTLHQRLFQKCVRGQGAIGNRTLHPQLWGFGVFGSVSPPPPPDPQDPTDSMELSRYTGLAETTNHRGISRAAHEGSERVCGLQKQPIYLGSTFFSHLAYYYHGQRSLVGYIVHGVGKELDTT